jgi:hypothetical protein
MQRRELWFPPLKGEENQKFYFYFKLLPQYCVTFDGFRSILFYTKKSNACEK